MGRPALSDQEFEREQERIRDAAQALFEEGGRDAVTLRAISKAIGSSAMQPYRYFPGGKDEILATVKARAFDRFAVKLSEMPDEELSDIETLEAYCKFYVDFALDDPSSFSLMFEQNFESESEFPELQAAAERARGPVIEAIHRVVESSNMIEPPEKVGQVLWASVHGLVMLHLSGQLKFGESIEDLTPILVNLLKTALLSNNVS